VNDLPERYLVSGRMVSLWKEICQARPHCRVSYRGPLHPRLDADFRNDIGHHAAHYEQQHDAIVIFDTKDAGTVRKVVGYTEFYEKVLDLFGALELAATYHKTFTFTSTGGLSDCLLSELRCSDLRQRSASFQIVQKVRPWPPRARWKRQRISKASRLTVQSFAVL
jgi:hypothetical protein